MHGRHRRTARRTPRRAWLPLALQVVGGWLVVSPLVLSSLRVTPGTVSAVTSGLALVVLGGWARAAGNRVAPLLVALAVGLWLLAVPSLWEFGDGVDAFPLVPIPPTAVAEPTRAVIARAEWNSILAGILVIALAGAALLAARRRRDRSAPTTGTDRQRFEAADEPG